MKYADSPVIITINELCSILKIGRNVAYKLLNSGQIKAFKVGRIWKIPTSSITDYVVNRSDMLFSKS